MLKFQAIVSMNHFQGLENKMELVKVRWKSVHAVLTLLPIVKFPTVERVDLQKKKVIYQY